MQRRGGRRVDRVKRVEDAMKPIVFAALALVSLVPVAQAQSGGGPYRGNPVELSQMPEAGSQAVPGGGGGQSNTFRNQAQSPIPDSRDEWRMKPGEADLPIPEVRPVPGTPLPPARTTR
jgi:hypothetical protein